MPGRELRGAGKVEESLAIEYMLLVICGWLGDDGVCALCVFKGWVG